MNTINPTNPGTQSRATGPATAGAATQSQPASGTESTRAAAKAMAEPIQETKVERKAGVFDSLNFLVNGLKKLGSGAMWASAVVCAGLSLASFFILNIQIAGIFFAVPALMSAFIAYHLSRTPKDSDPGAFTKDSLDIVQDAIEKPELLETHSNAILQAVNEAMEELEKNPDKTENLSSLNELKDIIKARLSQVQVKGYENDERNVAITRELERFLLAMNDLPEIIDAEVVNKTVKDDIEDQSPQATAA